MYSHTMMLAFHIISLISHYLIDNDTKQDCSILMVPKLLVVGIVLMSVQTKMSLADKQKPLSSIINPLCSDWAQLMQITGPCNKQVFVSSSLISHQ